MKILCPCGAKFAVDVTPEMAQTPVQFICPSCGLDSSAAVNELIRQEQETVGAASAIQPQVAAAGKPGLQIARSHSSSTTAPPPPETEVCGKHREAIQQHCLICRKPMCAKCIELFGFVCSAFCKAKAEAQKIHLPEHAGKKSVIEARVWRKVGRAVAAVGVVVALLVGAWIWYAWFGSHPKPFFSVKFPDNLGSGQSVFCGDNQLLFRHELVLSRYDLKAKKEVWSQPLLSEKDLDEAVAAETRAAQSSIIRAKAAGRDLRETLPSTDEMRENIRNAAAFTMEMYVQGSNIWVSSDSGKIARYDWNTGKPVKEISLPNGFRQLARNDENLLFQTRNDAGQRSLRCLNLISGDVIAESLNSPTEGNMVAGKSPPAGSGISSRASQSLDPAVVADQAQRLSFAGKLALPAVLANAMYQQRLDREMNGADTPGKISPLDFDEDMGTGVKLISSKQGDFEFTVRLLEKRIVARDAMKAAPKKSALNGNVTASQSGMVANELLNEMRRNAGAGTVMENQSRYLVTVHSVDGNSPDWTGEVIGKPVLIPEKSVTVIAAGSMIYAFDRANKKLWQASFTHRVTLTSPFQGAADSQFGAGPCVEHNGRLFVCDEEMLTALDATTGNVFWRLPSVGIAGIFFDNKGMLYINSTTASPDDVKFSKQIDINRQIRKVVLKVDPKSGKTLWATQAGALVQYVSGKYIYAWNANDGDYEQGGGLKQLALPQESYVQIKRLDPDNGKILWTYSEKRAPLDVKFNANYIQLVFPNELEVLKYFSI
ncbi:MAG TPA: PQQ-binding-like beta-propeller repeat protein [Verrucomicrobiae bacterium]|nr:PQQ-binding-like beta-propeller repeat protein [Verrucomicrobiae bacterium]